MGRRSALVRYVMAGAIVAAGAAAAMARFPDGFDWAYTVISKLASRKHNPAGGVWLSAALLTAMLLLWPVTSHLARAAAGRPRAPRLPVAALRVGLAGAALLGLEGLLHLDFSRVARKGHELLALLTFLGLYCGVLGLYSHRIRQQTRFLLPALLVVLPLFAIGLSQLALYVGQRELGWVNTSWRELGVPVWLSFAFWQWAAVALLWTGLGHLIATRPEQQPLNG
jgi:hypothetical protein